MTGLFEEAFRHHQAGRLGDAERLYREILGTDPDHARALHLLGLLAFQAGDAATAAELIGKAVSLDQAQPAFFYNLGVVLHALRRLEEAGKAYVSALQLQPDYAEAHDNLGLVLGDLGRWQEASGEHLAAIRHRYDFAQAHCNLGSALVQLGRVQDAIIPYRTAIRLKPDHAEAVAQLFYCLRLTCDWRDIEGIEQDLLNQTSKFSPFLLLLADSTGERQLAAARIWCAQHDGIVPLPPEVRPRGEKIRIGYLSADFCNHAVAQLIVELIERHDRERFDVIGYSYAPEDGSALRRRLRQGFDRFEDIRALSDAQAAQLIRRDGVDILIDLTGYTAKGRTGILAYRPAPAQVNFLGYPGTLGAGFVDYIIADPICIPVEDEPFFSETVVRLDCYQPNDGQREIDEETPSRAACGLGDRGLVFCCFNGSAKITPALFAVWMRLLAQVPGSLLWLLDANDAVKANLRREASDARIAPERLVFAPRIGPAQHLARQRLADLFLDTLPYNAHTTAADALWAGLPVLTCKGKTFPGRVAASLLTAVGMEELITASLADYEALALALARDPARLASLKAKLGPEAPLFDSAKFARAIETAYRRMV